MALSFFGGTLPTQWFIPSSIIKYPNNIKYLSNKLLFFEYIEEKYENGFDLAELFASVTFLIVLSWIKWPGIINNKCRQ